MTPDPTRALLCYDGSEHARLAIARAGALLGARAAVVLSVWVPARLVTSFDPVGDAVGRVTRIYEEMDTIAAEFAERQAGAGAELAREAGFEASADVAHGPVWPTIVAAADRAGAGVVVLGARGMGAVRSALMGSVSSGVLHHSRRPVLVVPDEGRAAVG